MGFSAACCPSGRSLRLNVYFGTNSMHLKELLENIYEGKLDPLQDHPAIDAIYCDSRKVGKNSLFVALKGHQYDGADFPNILKNSQ